MSRMERTFTMGVLCFEGRLAKHPSSKSCNVPNREFSLSWIPFSKRLSMDYPLTPVSLHIVTVFVKNIDEGETVESNKRQQDQILFLFFYFAIAFVTFKLHTYPIFYFLTLTTITSLKFIGGSRRKQLHKAEVVHK
ncbi:hypothetical protein DICVIV_05042 [Dictyocaulus viviparus]|uniref:Uncharacterized protein n=1 Tax=Dictyocaulus viviparus TaxID=29172 RepID=A0A0D8XYE1_DICVI|nr:hypothetical protein DICVIV_05042 [Dictyocaulus viviparus]